MPNKDNKPISEVDETKEVPEEGQTNPMTDIDFSFLDKVSEDSKDDKPKGAEETVEEEEVIIADVLDEKVPVPKSEWKTNIQKGLDWERQNKKRLEAEEKATALELERNELKIKLDRAEILTQRKAMLKKFEDDGFDTKEIDKYINTHPAILKAEAYVKQMEEQNEIAKMQSRVTKEKEALRSSPYFTELEAQIDKTMHDFPKVEVAVAYTLALGDAVRNGKLKLSDIKDKAKQDAKDEIHDNIKRGVKNMDSDSTETNKTTKTPTSFSKAFNQSIAHLLPKKG
jgi:hypothetical protein